jgi:hypothetical protein
MGPAATEMLSAGRHNPQGDGPARTGRGQECPALCRLAPSDRNQPWPEWSDSGRQGQANSAGQNKKAQGLALCEPSPAAVRQGNL